MAAAVHAPFAAPPAPRAGPRARSRATAAVCASGAHAFWGSPVGAVRGGGARRARRRRGGGVAVTAVYDPDSVEDPLLRQALKEPVAFFGGMFAGRAALNLCICILYLPRFTGRIVDRWKRPAPALSVPRGLRRRGSCT